MKSIPTEVVERLRKDPETKALADRLARGEDLDAEDEAVVEEAIEAVIADRKVGG